MTDKTGYKRGQIIDARKRQIVEFIRLYTRQNQIAPTIREITTGIGYSKSSYGTVHTYIDQLIKAGVLERFGKTARSIRLKRPTDEALG